MAEALERGATAFGVSARPGRAVGWYHARPRRRLRALAPDWRAELHRAGGAGADPGGTAAMERDGAGGERAADAGVPRRLQRRGRWSGRLSPAQRLAADPARVHVDPALVQRARDARRNGGLAARIACEPGTERPRRRC